MTPASAKGIKSSFDNQFQSSPGYQPNQVLIELASLPRLVVQEELQGLDVELFTQRANDLYL
jgi:hypothetical protein